MTKRTAKYHHRYDDDDDEDDAGDQDDMLHDNGGRDPFSVLSIESLAQGNFKSMCAFERVFVWPRLPCVESAGRSSRAYTRTRAICIYIIKHTFNHICIQFQVH